jgi:hypothetical protein
MNTQGHWIVMVTDKGGCPSMWSTEPFTSEEHAQELADELVTYHWYISEAWVEYVKGEGR